MSFTGAKAKTKMNGPPARLAGTKPVVNPSSDPNCPFKIETNAEVGRHIVATRAIAAGDTILKDWPLAVGPQKNSPPICLGCYGPVDGDTECDKCGWLVCSKECSKKPGHAAECSLLHQAGRRVFLPPDENQISSLYECIPILRCLYYKNNDPQRWEVVKNMETHMERRMTSDLYAHTEMLIFFMRTLFGLNEQDYPDEDIHHIAASVDINAYEIRMPTFNILGLYPYACLPEHNCVGNTLKTIEEDYTLVLRAAIDIKAGDHIKVSYTDPMWATSDRRAHLLYSKYFECNCERCTDPTECKSFLGGLHCPLCNAPSLVPLVATDPESDWKCQECSEEVISQYASKLIQDGYESLHEVEEMEEPDPKAYEDYLEQYSGLLHVNHAHCVDAKSTLVHLYGTADGYELHKMNSKQLNRKEELCKDLLAVADKILPGLSRFRGTISYELAKTLMQKTRNEYDSKKQPKSETMKSLITRTRASLQDTIANLKYEASCQPEGELTKQAADNLKDFNEWLQSIGSS